MKRTVRITILLLILAMTVILNGCNTVEGAGKDIEAAGEGIQDVAD